MALVTVPGIGVRTPKSDGQELVDMLYDWSSVFEGHDRLFDEDDIFNKQYMDWFAYVSAGTCSDGFHCGSLGNY